MKKVILLIVFFVSSFLLIYPQQKKNPVQFKIVGVNSEISKIEKELESMQDITKLKNYFDLILSVDELKSIKDKNELQKVLQDRAILFSNTGEKFVFKDESIIDTMQVILNKYSGEGWEMYQISDTKDEIFITFKR